MKTVRERIWRLLALLWWLPGAAAGGEVVIPPVVVGEPGPGKRVVQVLKSHEESSIRHLLYLPTDWKPGEKYPVVVEYPGNQWKGGPGTVGGCRLGFGLSGGKGVIWLCLPFVDAANRRHAVKWWGDVESTVAYCKSAVAEVCANNGGNKEQVYLAGFSRGSIACHYIGLHDDEIALLWRGFICHSHYDGVRRWGYAGDDRKSAMVRLQRLGKRPQFISHEGSVGEVRAYLGEVKPDGNFTFCAISSPQHSANWVMNDCPERDKLRRWFRESLQAEPAGRP